MMDHNVDDQAECVSARSMFRFSSSAAVRVQEFSDFRQAIATMRI